MHAPGAPGCLPQRGCHPRIEPSECVRQRPARHDRRGQVNTVEPGRMLADRSGSASTHVLADPAHGRHRRLNVELGPRQQLGQLPDAQLGDRCSPQINPVEHPASLMGVAEPARTGGPWSWQRLAA